MNYFVTAIGTDSGKTLVSAMLVEAWSAEYWKPVQCGDPTDTETVRNLTEDRYTCHPEAYYLKKPASPHDAAREEGIEITVDSMNMPQTLSEHLIIEGAGGLTVPLSDSETMIDMIHRFKARVILVADLYLGSINHTMLTISKLIEERLPVEGIIFNGPENADSESYILKHCPWPCLFRIRPQDEVSPSVIQSLAKKFNEYVAS